MPGGAVAAKAHPSSPATRQAIEHLIASRAADRPIEEWQLAGELLASAPEDPAALLEHARTAARCRRFAAAEHSARSALECGADRREALYLLADIAFESSDWAGVVVALDEARALASAPAAGDGRARDRQLLIALRRKGDLVRGVQLAQELLDHDPTRSEYRTLLASVLVDAGRYDESLTVIGAAPPADRESPVLLTLSGIALEAVGRVAEAATCYRKILVASPERRSVQLDLARCLSQSDDMAERREARVLARNGLEDPRTELQAIELLARLERRAGNIAEAERLEARLGAQREARQESDDAVRSAVDRLRSDPDDGRALARLLRLRFERREYPAAIELAQRLLRSRPDDLDTLESLCNLQMLVSEPRKAYLEAVKIKSLHPEDPRGDALLAWTAVAVGRLDEARLWGELAIQQSPDSQRLLTALETVYAAGGAADMQNLAFVRRRLEELRARK